MATHILSWKKLGAFVALKTHLLHLRGSNLFKIGQEVVWCLVSVWTQWGEKEWLP